MKKLLADIFICRTDNFGLLVHSPGDDLTMAVDSPDGDEILRRLQKNDWHLSHVFNTHHHQDHICGNLVLKAASSCRIIGPKSDSGRIEGIDIGLEDGEKWMFGSHQARLIMTPGHTSGSCCLWFEQERLLFTGDTLFSMGCGRLFEGSAGQMFASLQKIAALPDDTMIYCGHEYSLTNAEFAIELEPGNEALQTRLKQVRKLRRAGLPTLPVSLATEKATNPFLRTHSPEIRQNLGFDQGIPDIEVFAAIRELRNNF